MYHIFHKKNKTTFLIPVFTAVLFLAGSTISNASIIDTIKDKIKTKTEELEQLRKDIFKVQATVDTTQKQAQTLQGDIKSLDTTRSKLLGDIKSTESTISKTERTIGTLLSEIEKIQDTIEDKQTLIRSIIKSQRNEDNLSLLEHLLSDESLSDVTLYLDQSAKLNDSLKNEVLKLRSINEELVYKKSTTETKKEDLKKLKSNLSGQEKSVAQTKLEKDKLLLATKNQEAEYKKLLAEKQMLAAEFEKQLFSFESELKLAVDPSKLPTAKGGVLSWPLSSVFFTQYFGSTVAAKKLYTSGSHNGVDFRAADGTAVKASLSGSVWATGNTDARKGCYSYGKWILIKHSNGLSTLYAHLSSISVNQGADVVTGDIIGYSGRTGYVTGPHLHLTVLATEGTQLYTFTPDRSTNCVGMTIPVADPKAYLDPMVYLPTL